VVIGLPADYQVGHPDELWPRSPRRARIRVAESVAQRNLARIRHSLWRTGAPSRQPLAGARFRADARDRRRPPCVRFGVPAEGLVSKCVLCGMGRLVLGPGFGGGGAPASRSAGNSRAPCDCTCSTHRSRAVLVRRIEIDLSRPVHHSSKSGGTIETAVALPLFPRAGGSLASLFCEASQAPSSSVHRPGQPRSSPGRVQRFRRCSERSLHRRRTLCCPTSCLGPAACMGVAIEALRPLSCGRSITLHQLRPGTTPPACGLCIVLGALAQPGARPVHVHPCPEPISSFGLWVEH